MARQARPLTGIQKAAILLIALGPDISAKVMKNLTDEEVEQISLEISSIQKVEPEIKEEIIEQFHQIAVAQDYISQGGVSYTKMLLEKAFCEHEAMKIINRITSSIQIRIFDFYCITSLY